METKKYIVMVDDPFHYMDDGERDQAGIFDTPEEAINRCKEIIEASIQYKVGMTAKELFFNYCMFGDDPFIIGDVTFSARAYAREYCVKLCKKK